MALIYLVFICAIFYWQLKRVRSGCSTVKAVVAYFGYGLMPAMLYVLVFMGLVGIEALFGERQNKDRQSGTANRIQISGKYSF